MPGAPLELSQNTYFLPNFDFSYSCCIFLKNDMLFSKKKEPTLKVSSKSHLKKKVQNSRARQKLKRFKNDEFDPQTLHPLLKKIRPTRSTTPRGFGTSIFEVSGAPEILTYGDGQGHWPWGHSIKQLFIKCFHMSHQKLRFMKRKSFKFWRSIYMDFQMFGA